MEAISRFCPKCGAKARAKPEVFDEPQKCPSCKEVGLFWDLSKEPLPEAVEAIKIKPILNATAITGVAIAFLLYSILILLAVALGFSVFPTILSLIAIGLSTAGVIFAIGQQYRMATVVDAFQKLVPAVEAARALQIEVGRKYYTLQSNLKSITAEAIREAEESKHSYTEKLLQLEQEVEKRTAAFRAEAQRQIEEANANSRSRIKLYAEKEQELTIQVNSKVNAASSAVQAMSTKLLTETKSFLRDRLTTNNLSQSLNRFRKAVEFCIKGGAFVSDSEIEGFEKELKSEFEVLVRKQVAKEEQARIKEKIREEQKIEAEIERELKRNETERRILEEKLAEAIAKAHGEANEQIEELKRKLEEAESRQRAISLAQQTKAGYVYVISNIGSFGSGVYKIGMTRRLDPMDRVRELGDASVPFPFDVHMMISCDDAPSLENELHKMFSRNRINKVNFRKEFFRVSLDSVVQCVERLHGKVEYEATPEALQFHESEVMSESEFAMVEAVVGDLADDPDEIDE